MPSPREIAQRWHRSWERMLKRAHSSQQPEQPLRPFFFGLVKRCSICSHTDPPIATLSSQQIGQRRRRLCERGIRCPSPVTTSLVCFLCPFFIELDSTYVVFDHSMFSPVHSTSFRHHFVNISTNGTASSSRMLRFRRTHGPYHLILSYLPLSRSAFPLSYADTSDCPFPISYPLSPRIFDRP